MAGLLAREEGKTIAEAVGETVRASQVFKFFAGEALRNTGDAVASVRPGIDVMIERVGCRRDRPDHPLELPDRHSGLEAGAGTCLWQRGGDESPLS